MPLASAQELQHYPKMKQGTNDQVRQLQRQGSYYHRTELFIHVSTTGLSGHLILFTQGIQHSE